MPAILSDAENSLPQQVLDRLVGDADEFTPAQPAGDQMLWRYITAETLQKHSENLHWWFSSASTFQDPWEMTAKTFNVARIWKALAAGPECSRENRQEFLENMASTTASTDHRRETTGFSCWFASEHESALMWDSYAHTCRSTLKPDSADTDSLQPIAFGTTFKTLATLAQETTRDVRYGAVTYADIKSRLDLAKLPLRADEFIKRLPYMSEQEVRFAIELTKFGSKGEYLPAELGPAIKVVVMREESEATSDLVRRAFPNAKIRRAETPEPFYDIEEFYEVLGVDPPTP